MDNVSSIVKPEDGYCYIVVDSADEFYEEGKYLKKFDNYQETYDYLSSNHYEFLLGKLEYLEGLTNLKIKVVSYY